MSRLSRQANLFLYEGSYLLDKHLMVKHADKLSDLFNPAPLYFNVGKEYDSAAGIMQRLGQQWLARDYLQELLGTHDRTKLPICEYHFACFIMLTKSTFDLIAHLINQVLKLRFQGRYVDLASIEFRNRIVKESPTLGGHINRQSPWIVEISKFRKAIEHTKTVRLTYFNPDELRRAVTLNPEPPLRFPTVPLSYSEELNLVVQDRDNKTRRYQTREILPYCDLCLKKTQQIVEKTLEVAYEKLRDSKVVKQFRAAREEAIRSSKASIEPGRLDSLGQISSDTIRTYLEWKFPQRDSGEAASGAFSDLLSELRNADIRNYRELDKDIDDNMGWFLDYERKNPPFVPISWEFIRDKTKDVIRLECDAIFVVRNIVQEMQREKRRR